MSFLAHVSNDRLQVALTLLVLGEVDLLSRVNFLTTTSCSVSVSNVDPAPSESPGTAAVSGTPNSANWSNSFLLDVLPALSSAIPSCRLAQLPDTSVLPEFLGRGVILSFRHRHTYDCCLRKTDPVTLIS